MSLVWGEPKNPGTMSFKTGTLLSKNHRSGIDYFVVHPIRKWFGLTFGDNLFIGVIWFDQRREARREAGGALAAKDAEIASLRKQVEELTRVRNSLVLSTGEHITHRSELLTRAEAAEARVTALQQADEQRARDISRLTVERDEARAALAEAVRVIERILNAVGCGVDLYADEPGKQIIRDARDFLSRHGGQND